MSEGVELRQLLEGLPPEPDEAALQPRLQAAVGHGRLPVVAIDDDPTGVQTVYDTPVLLDWTAAELDAALADPRQAGAASTSPVVFVLTNSRSMPLADAEQINRRLGEQLAGRRSDGSILPIVSRSDSTLRGHYPGEVLALQQGLGTPVDGHLLVPAFFEGGRYTIHDRHWVASPDATSSRVIAASDTPFARDATFGFSTSYLPAWVEEKSRGQWRAEQVQSIDLATTRQGPEAVAQRLLGIDGGVPVVVNAAGYGDLTSFVIGLLAAEARGKRFLYRSAASFVRVRAGLARRSLLSVEELASNSRGDGPSGTSSEGGLVVVGSHVPMSSAQLGALLDETSPVPTSPVEVTVEQVLGGTFDAEAAAARLDEAMRDGRVAVLFTSRQLVSGSSEESLAIGRRTMDALIATIRQIAVRPRFVVAKGGITSHEVARRGLGARRATALGQLLPGVPVWRLESTPELRFPGVPYVVFPGNVGGERSLLTAVVQLSA